MLFKMTAFALALSFAASAIDKNTRESCFLAIPFANGNTASIQLSNAEKKEQSADIERYSANGHLLETVTKSVPGGGHVEARLDLSSPTPEFGWIRVLAKGKGISVYTAVETLHENTLESIPQGAVYRHPAELNKHLFAAVPHKWTYDVANNLGFLFYFVNLSEYPVQVGMCQDERPNCTNPTLPSTVASMASISFPIDQSRRYAVIESSPGYSVATTLRLSDGTKKVFDTSTCVTFEGSASCSPQPASAPSNSTRFITPLEQTVRANVDASKSSPAAVAANQSNPQELAELINNGKASKCVVVTDPPAAEIYIDGLKAAVTPFVFVLIKKGDTPRTIEIRMNGYRTIDKHVVPDGHLITIEATLEKQ